VGGVGVLCGLLLAALFWSLTRSALPSLVIGVATASILVVLAVAGGRYNQTFADTADRRAEALAKRARVRKAIEETHGDN
jgi:membrane protein implicated in regulation of membrane protease activity